MTKNRLLSLIVTLFASGATVRADGEGLATAAQYAGFALFGNHNPLSGGIDFLAVNEFNAETPFDFGAWNLALDGPLSLGVSTGGRLVSQFDISLTTGSSGDAQAVPLEYSYNFEIGPQNIRIDGSVLADVDLTLNSLGYYDLNLNASGRRTRTTDGVVTETRDFDAGPVSLSGNLYFDALALLTDPLFDQTGQENFFLKLSGNDALAAMLDDSSSGIDAKRMIEASYKVIVPPGIADGIGNGTQSGFMSGQGNGPGGPAVPEPAVLVLMLLGAPVILFRSRFTR